MIGIRSRGQHISRPRSRPRASRLRRVDDAGVAAVVEGLVAELLELVDGPVVAGLADQVPRVPAGANRRAGNQTDGVEAEAEAGGDVRAVVDEEVGGIEA